MRRIIPIFLIISLLLFPSMTLGQSIQPDLATISKQLTELKQEINQLITKLEKILNRLEVIESKLKITKVPKPSLPKADITVYVTQTGRKYHRITCRYLKNRKIFSIKRSRAIREGYIPCSVCKPP